VKENNVPSLKKYSWKDKQTRPQNRSNCYYWW